MAYDHTPYLIRQPPPSPSIENFWMKHWCVCVCVFVYVCMCLPISLQTITCADVNTKGGCVSENHKSVPDIIYTGRRWDKIVIRVRKSSDQ